ncbi:MAG TPA: hypothetical protein VLJ57_24455 [Burkholderiaceae bacterium]|nr:hypothetical protein [Burkholderiaceae bacterium]
MQIPYLVTLTGAPDFPTSKRIAAEVRFASSLEQACGDSGGVVTTYCDAQGYLDARAIEEAASDLDEPDTVWTAALRTAEEAAWASFPRPAGAQFYVRVTVPATVFDLPDGERRVEIAF